MTVEQLSGAGEGGVDPAADRRVHIVLFGLTGSGKTTVGHRVANELGRPFVDNDSMVALRTGRPPDELVEATDVAELQAVEEAVFRRVVAMQDAVVYAAAASVVDVLEPDDLDGAWCVWLEASPGELADRIANDHPRSLLGSDPAATLARQHRGRSQQGRRLAHFTIETDGSDPNEVAARVCRAWRSSPTSAGAHRARRIHRTSIGDSVTARDQGFGWVSTDRRRGR